MRSRILVLSGDVALRARLAQLLNGAGYRVELAESSRHARQIGLKDFALAIVVQDVLAPGDGILDELEAAIGKVLMIAAPGSRQRPGSDVLATTDGSGLLARVAETLRLVSKADETAPALLRFAGYSLDLGGHSLIDRAGTEVSLTPGEFSLLREFVQRPGRALSRDHLLQALSGRDAESFDRGIDMLVVRLRRKIEPDPKRPRLIVTVLGTGYKFMATVQKAEGNHASVPQQVAAPVERMPAPAERRQVTALSGELIAANGGGLPADPEELRTTIDAFRRRATAVITRHGGVMAQGSTREVLAYFGHPIAREDDAERAIHAALELAENLDGGDLELSVGRSVRAGIATGLVVAGSTGEVMGEAPSQAASLQRIAEPGQVIIATSTRRLVERMFAYQAVRPMTRIEGADLVEAWGVTGPSEIASRSEALYAATLTPMVGRDEELGLLSRAWQQAKSGDGRVVLLSGDPGIGKSRLLAALEKQLIAETHQILRYFCSSHHQDSPLYPLIARLEREAGLMRGDTSPERLTKLEAVLAPNAPSPEDITLLAALLSIPTDERYPALELSPRQQKARTSGALLRRLAALAREEPVLILFEDMHWSDPSSVELLDAVIEQVPDLPVLLIISFRPEFVTTWFGRHRVSLMALSRLDKRDATALAAQIVKGHILAPPILDRIVMHSDGVPLFIEELSRSVLEASERDTVGTTMTVPNSLQATLMARLDRLPAAKPVAQIASVIGREFSHSLLAAAAEMQDVQIVEGLNELAAAGLLFRRGTPPDAVYAFKHALVRDIVYASLPRIPRQQLHRAIGGALRDQLSERAETEPEIVAYHLAQAGMKDAAVEWWSKAGHLALQRSAHIEAVAHLEKALELSRELSDSPEQRLQLLRLQIIYGNALRTVRGFAAPETLTAFVRARDIAKTIPDVPERFAADYGLWSGSFLGGDLSTMRELAHVFLRNIEDRPELSEIGVAHRIRGQTSWFAGEFVDARMHLEHALAHYDGKRDLPSDFRFGQDLVVPVMAYLAMTLWPSGNGEAANRLIEKAVTRAVRTRHIPTVAYAYMHASAFEMMRGGHVKCGSYVRAYRDLAREHGMPMWLANGVFQEGWLRWHEGDRDAGTARMHEGLGLLHGQAQSVFVPFYKVLLAETEAEAGDPEAALVTIAAALASMTQTGECWFLGEAHRVWGEILLKATPTDREAAEAVFVQAIEVARGNATKRFELRAALRLAQMWTDHGRRVEHQGLLAALDGGRADNSDAKPLAARDYCQMP